MSDELMPDGAPWIITDETRSMFELKFKDDWCSHMIYKETFWKICDLWPFATEEQRSRLVQGIHDARDGVREIDGGDDGG